MDRHVIVLDGSTVDVDKNLHRQRFHCIAGDLEGTVTIRPAANFNSFLALLRKHEEADGAD